MKENGRTDINLTESIAKHLSFPSLDDEKGEIERVAKEFAKISAAGFIERFKRIAKSCVLSKLDEETWKILENSDSFDIAKEDWRKVRKNSFAGGESPKDWHIILDKFKSGYLLDAPIILKIGEKLHLLSGNTRLMVARALGITPMVLIVDMA